MKAFQSSQASSLPQKLLSTMNGSPLPTPLSSHPPSPCPHPIPMSPSPFHALHGPPFLAPCCRGELGISGKDVKETHSLCGPGVSPVLSFQSNSCVHEDRGRASGSPSSPDSFPSVRGFHSCLPPVSVQSSVVSDSLTHECHARPPLHSHPHQSSLRLTSVSHVLSPSSSAVHISLLSPASVLAMESLFS